MRDSAVTRDDSLIRKSKIISSDQLSTGRLQQKTEQINLEFSEDSRDNDIREGTFHICELSGGKT